MKNKVNIEEGLQSLERILLMMNYDNKKTLSENYNLINEQSSQIDLKPKEKKGGDQDVLSQRTYMTGDQKLLQDVGLEKYKEMKGIEYDYSNVRPSPPYSDTISAPGQTGESEKTQWKLPYLSNRAYVTLVQNWKNYYSEKPNCYSIGNTKIVMCIGSKGKSYLQDVYKSDLSDYDKKYPGMTPIDLVVDCMNSHECSSQVSLALAGLGFLTSVIPPVSAAFFAASTAIDLYDAKKYWDEGDEYSAGLYAALSIIPGGELLKITGKSAGQLGKFFKILKSGGKLTDEGIESISKLGKFISENTQQFNNLIKLGMKTKVISGLNQLFVQNPQQFFNILYTLWKNIPTFAKLAVQVGGTYYTFDQIYLAWYHNNQGKLDDRTLNPIKQLVDWMSNKDNEKEVIDATNRKFASITVDNIGEIQKRDPKVESYSFADMKNKMEQLRK